MSWTNLIGKKVLAFRGYVTQPVKVGNIVVKKSECLMSIVLFDDGKTFLRFSEQDRYDYHDCDSSARTMSLEQDEEKWKLMFDKVDSVGKVVYDEPTNVDYPF